MTKRIGNHFRLNFVFFFCSNKRKCINALMYADILLCVKEICAGNDNNKKKGFFFLGKTCMSKGSVLFIVL